jgi:hypothetical protein
MKTGAAEEFLAYLERHPAVKEILTDAVLEDIVAAGAARGYLFSVEDLEQVLKQKNMIRGWGG